MARAAPRPSCSAVTEESTGWRGFECASTDDMNETQAEERLLELERMLEQAPHEVLGIERSEGVLAASVAFSTAATRYHPRWFVGMSPATLHRASQGFARLRAAYRALAQSLLRMIKSDAV